MKSVVTRLLTRRASTMVGGVKSPAPVVNVTLDRVREVVADAVLDLVRLRRERDRVGAVSRERGARG